MVEDYQRERVYRWEDMEVGPLDKMPPVSFDRAQALVTAIWSAYGLINPPKVHPLPRQARRMVASGGRETIRIPLDKPTPTWILLHEIAHSMTTTVDDECDHHGPDFVGMYMDLLERFCKMPKPLLWFTAKKAGLEFTPTVKPYCLD